MVTNGVTLVGQGWKNTVIKQTAAAGANSRVVTLDGGVKIEGVTLTVGTENDVKDVTLAQGTLKVGVTDVQANYWYAVEKATDLAKGFTVDATTWVSGASLLAGTKDLEIALGANEPQAFYRVVVSTTAP